MVAAIIRPRCSARQRYVIISIVVHLFRIILLLPHLFLFSSLQVDHCRCLVTDAHVGTVIVVEVYEPPDDVSCVLYTVECLSGVFHWLKGFTPLPLPCWSRLHILLFPAVFLDACLDSVFVVRHGKDNPLFSLLYIVFGKIKEMSSILDNWSLKTSKLGA